MLRREVCGFRTDSWPANHACDKSKGHMSRHVCWCGAFHEQGNHSGRWEDYMKPEFKGDKK